MKIKSKKKSFTLIEVLLSIFIISITSCVIGISIYKAISTYRFEKNCSRFIDKLLFIKKISFLQDLDIVMEITEKNKNLILEIFPQNRETIFFQKKILEKFPNLKMKFRKEKIKHLNFFFSKSGFFTPHGKFILYDKKRKKEVFLESIFFKDMKN